MVAVEVCGAAWAMCPSVESATVEFITPPRPCGAAVVCVKFDTDISFAYQILLVRRILPRGPAPCGGRFGARVPAWCSAIAPIGKGIHLDFQLDTPAAPA